MALPTSTGDWPYPYGNSPARTFYQAYKTMITTTSATMLATISNTKDFVTTRLVCNIDVADPTGLVTVRSNNETIATIQGVAVGTYNMDFGVGIRATAADTATVQFVISGGTCSASLYVQGYFD